MHTRIVFLSLVGKKIHNSFGVSKGTFYFHFGADLFTFVELFDSLDIAGTEARFVIDVKELSPLLLGCHRLGPSVFGECPLAVQHDGIVVESVQDSILGGHQLVKLVLSRCGRGTFQISAKS